jgi:tRNA-modifying protein YgfZ
MRSIGSASRQEEYAMLRASAGFSARGAGFITLQGEESRDLLNRMSTNDLKELKPLELRPTILTTEKGRMIDLALVANPGDRLLLIVSEGNAARVKSWLEKYIIMEDIIVTDVTANYKRISIIGPKAPSIIVQVCGKDVSMLGESLHPLGDGSDLFLFRNPEWPVEAYDIVGNPDEIDRFATSLGRGGEAGGNAYEVTPDAVDLLRVELGIPLGGKEIDDRVNPLEAGLTRFVSFTKGCYIGQEVIARVDTYKKLHRTLRGFIFPEGDEAGIPGKLLFDGFDAGWTTSHVFSTLVGRELALGYLKVFPQSGTVSFVGEGADQEIPLEVADLPFHIPDSPPLQQK